MPCGGDADCPRGQECAGKMCHDVKEDESLVMGFRTGFVRVYVQNYYFLKCNRLNEGCVPIILRRCKRQ